MSGSSDIRRHGLFFARIPAGSGATAEAVLYGVRRFRAAEKEYADNPVGGGYPFFYGKFPLRTFMDAADADQRAKRKAKHFIVLKKTEKV